MTKLTFPQQNLLSHDKTYFSTAKFYTAKKLGRNPSTIKMATANDDNANEDGDTEEVLITYYFYRGYQYRDILDFLATHHNIEMSERTLHRRLRTYGLSRRADGYDKFKPFGFPVHGCIDGWGRKLLWLVATRSNNSPDNSGSYFLDAVKTCGGCPCELVTDLGTENKIMASMQAFFRDSENAHKYVASPRNQRIEGYWSQYRRNRSTWWINLFSFAKGLFVVLLCRPVAGRFERSKRTLEHPSNKEI